MTDPRQVWLVIDTGPIGSPLHANAFDGSDLAPAAVAQPLGVVEGETDGHAVAAWRYAVERRTTELRVVPFIPEAETLEVFT